MNKPGNKDFIHKSMSLYSSIILQYSLCANAFEIIETLYPIKMHAFPPLLVNKHNKTAMEDPHPHKCHNQVEIPETTPFDLTFLPCFQGAGGSF